MHPMLQTEEKEEKRRKKKRRKKRKIIFGDLAKMSTRFVLISAKSGPSFSGPVFRVICRGGAAAPPVYRYTYGS
jgi:hypothetical protein